MKQVGYYHVFPFQEISRGTSVVICGVKEIWGDYLRQILKTDYCNIEFIADKNWQDHKDVTVDVMPMFAIRHVSQKVSIVIAHDNEEASMDIRKQLQGLGIDDRRIIWKDILIAESMVVSTQVAGLTPQVRRWGFYHIFPFNRLEPGDKILIWGMGEVGQHYVRQIQGTGYCKLEAAVDSNWRKHKNAPVDVHTPTYVKTVRDARIVIANGNKNSAEKIREQIKEMGIDSSRVLWDDLIIEGEVTTGELMPYSAENDSCDGSESALSARPHPQSFASLLMPYDIISFSIFDLLIFRHVFGKDEIKEICIPNPYMLEVYKILIGEGKKIICVSDLDHDEEKLKLILASGGYMKYSAIYIASEHDALFNMKTFYYDLKKHGQNLKYVHVGSDYERDVILAGNCGVDGILYQNIEDYAAGRRPRMKSENVGSAYALTVNRRLHQDGRIYSRPYEYGFIGGGILALGFVQWVIQYVKKHNIDKILFLSGDSDALYQIHQMLSNSENAAIGCWSKSIGISLAKNEKFNDEEAVRGYIKSLLGYAKRVALVDVSCFGKSALTLSDFIEKTWGSLYEVDVLTMSKALDTVLRLKSEHSKNAREDTSSDRKIKCFLEGYQESTDGLECILQGVFFGTPVQILKGISKESGVVKFHHSLPIVENEDVALDLREGVLQFCKEYIKCYSSYDDMFNISAWDAYLPFLELAKQIKHEQKNLASYRIVNDIVECGDVFVCRTFEECLRMEEVLHKGEKLA